MLETKRAFYFKFSNLMIDIVYNHEKKVENVTREIEFLDKQRRRLLRLIDDKGGYDYSYNITNEEIDRVMHYRFDEGSDNIVL